MGSCSQLADCGPEAWGREEGKKDMLLAFALGTRGTRSHLHRVRWLRAPMSLRFWASGPGAGRGGAAHCWVGLEGKLRLSSSAFGSAPVAPHGLPGEDQLLWPQLPGQSLQVWGSGLKAVHVPTGISYLGRTAVSAPAAASLGLPRQLEMR